MSSYIDATDTRPNKNQSKLLKALCRRLKWLSLPLVKRPKSSTKEVKITVTSTTITIDDSILDAKIGAFFGKTAIKGVVLFYEETIWSSFGKNRYKFGWLGSGNSRKRLHA